MTIAQPNVPQEIPHRKPSRQMRPALRMHRFLDGRSLGLFLRNKLAMAGLAYLCVVALISIAAPLLHPGNPLSAVGPASQWPGQNSAFPLGTDQLGRDVLAGLIYGGRVLLSVGILATLLGVFIGVTIGALAGYFGAYIDLVLSRIVEIFQTIPSFVLLTVLVAITDSSTRTITIAIGLISWPTIARVTRAEFRKLRESEFVMAGRSIGYGHARLILREILPNALPAVIVTASVMVASAILMESALSFMGFGDANVVSWGTMVGAGRQYLRIAWYLTAIPGFAIVLTVLAINLVGDGLNDALNPRFLERK